MKTQIYTYEYLYTSNVSIDMHKYTTTCLECMLTKEKKEVQPKNKGTRTTNKYAVKKRIEFCQSPLLKRLAAIVMLYIEETQMKQRDGKPNISNNLITCSIS